MESMERATVAIGVPAEWRVEEGFMAAAIVLFGSSPPLPKVTTGDWGRVCASHALAHRTRYPRSACLSWQRLYDKAISSPGFNGARPA